jgi:UDP-sugar pyrophosphorylase
LDASYPGGLAAYLTKAKALLREAAEGTNPFDAYEAEVPAGEVLSPAYDATDTATNQRLQDAESVGLNAVANVVFCLVAGGLGERLGYSGIKLSLSTNVCTDECYLALYASYILALQQAASHTTDDPVEIPLVIMTSGDTDAPTRQLLQEQSNFGLSPTQVVVVTQDKVAALCNGDAGLALDDDDRWTVQTKPHGHGDVHHLLYREGLVDQWERQGKTHVIFLQDTNGLVINSVLPTLGVSIQKGFHMNSICIPRLAGEAAGAIARLKYVERGSLYEIVFLTCLLGS